MTAIARELDEKLNLLDAKAAHSLERLVRDALAFIDLQSETSPLAEKRAVPQNSSKTGAENPQNAEAAILSSRAILDLKEDWDEQGSPGYEEATWRRACDFLLRQANFARVNLGRDLPVPKILPGPDASIDVHWKMTRFELLVNVPQDTSKPATFYGDDFGNSSIKGNLNPAEEVPGIVVWLLT